MSITANVQYTFGKDQDETPFIFVWVNSADQQEIHTMNRQKMCL